MSSPNYKLMYQQAKELLTLGDAVAKAANFSAFLYHELEDINWLGFYYVKDGQLMVGPFQGKPACILIPIGKGVCGTAAEQRKTLRVANVHQFGGHIACDVDSRSEIVIPLIDKQQHLMGVLDIDSPSLDRFNEQDQRGLEQLAELFVQSLE